MLVFSFFPRKHVFDRLQDAIINEVLKDNAEATAATQAEEELIEVLLWEVMELSENFSGIEQPNFHLRPHRVMRYSFSVLAKVIKLVYFNQWVEPEQKPSGEYSNFIPLLPEYYSFLFRLTPF
ncbi:hypothetical protein [Adhaeribacter rhizoryzae]|uniref:Uncharacterized protein n=1 Tax=Adhaeribacter rhizoryzae TaxID=2607907 RepID=A0A5M6DPP8_9BACT|nr:hypothetical protein [Adhaeribacter rhizoryzae]KAA5549487.1 hypothetical protein F0145_02565 [Adhaeribacter rhizoryzae]